MNKIIILCPELYSVKDREWYMNVKKEEFANRVIG